MRHGIDSFQTLLKCTSSNSRTDAKYVPTLIVIPTLLEIRVKISTKHV